jgi:hypothetical protein
MAVRNLSLPKRMFPLEPEREEAQALGRAIYGDLFPVVRNIENGNNSAAIK